MNANGMLLWQDAAKTIPIYVRDNAGNIIYEGGRPVNPAYLHYALPRAADMPRVRAILIEEGDPADVWEETERWLQARVSDEVLANYMMLRDRSIGLSDDVAAHFQEAAGQALHQVAVTDPVSLAGTTQVDHKIELAKMKVGKQAMVALKSAYGGVLMNGDELIVWNGLRVAKTGDVLPAIAPQ